MKLDRTTLKALTQNVMATPRMSWPKVNHDMRKARDKADVIGFQELKWRYYLTILARLFSKRAGWSHYPKRSGRGSAQAVAWNRERFRKISGHVVRLHKSSRFSMTRYVVVVLLEDKATGIRFWFTNRHYIVGAFDHDAEASARRVIWTAGNVIDQRTLNGLGRQPAQVHTADANARGRHVFGTHVGPEPVQYAWDQVDYLGVVDGKAVEAHVTDKFTVHGQNSDHAGKGAVITLIRKA